MAGPIPAIISRGEEPYCRSISASVFSTIRPTVPLHPAWMAATTSFFLSYRMMGTQSAVVAHKKIPFSRVMVASTPYMASMADG